MADHDDKDVPDLGIALETVATIADLLNALDDDDDDEGEEFSDEDNEGDDDVDDEGVTEELVEEMINELSEPEQAALVALALVGRGDHEAEDWTDAIKAASARNAKADPVEYLLNLEGAGELLAEGLSAFGVAIEDIER
jgi:DNA-directed RNA polymerase specialized sigma24 family protein